MISSQSNEIVNFFLIDKTELIVDWQLFLAWYDECTLVYTEYC
jgi:hypothetical protein